MFNIKQAKLVAPAYVLCCLLKMARTRPSKKRFQEKCFQMYWSRQSVINVMRMSLMQDKRIKQSGRPHLRCVRVRQMFWTEFLSRPPSCHGNMRHFLNVANLRKTIDGNIRRREDVKHHRFNQPFTLRSGKVHTVLDKDQMPDRFVSFNCKPGYNFDRKHRRESSLPQLPQFRPPKVRISSNSETSNELWG